MPCPSNFSPLLIPNGSLYDQIRDSWSKDPKLQALIVKLQTQPFKAFTWCSDQLR